MLSFRRDKRTANSDVGSASPFSYAARWPVRRSLSRADLVGLVENLQRPQARKLLSYSHLLHYTALVVFSVAYPSSQIRGISW